jgi:hypothetical protein
LPNYTIVITKTILEREDAISIRTPLFLVALSFFLCPEGHGVEPVTLGKTVASKPLNGVKITTRFDGFAEPVAANPNADQGPPKIETALSMMAQRRP